MPHDHLTIHSRAEWRAWLEANHTQHEGIWLISFKKGHGPYVAYADIVEEALAFGWIDSQPRTLDADRSQRRLAPRRPGSNWSRRNKDLVARLVGQDLMHPAGIAAVARAKADGTWTALDDVETLAEPEDLRAALDAREAARANWDAFPRSAKRAILEWITSAKRRETRGRRITETADRAAQNIRANQWRQTKP